MHRALLSRRHTSRVVVVFRATCLSPRVVQLVLDRLVFVLLFDLETQILVLLEPIAIHAFPLALD